MQLCLILNLRPSTKPLYHLEKGGLSGSWGDDSKVIQPTRVTHCLGDPPRLAADVGGRGGKRAGAVTVKSVPNVV